MSQAKRTVTTESAPVKETAHFSNANTFQIGDKPLNELAETTKNKASSRKRCRPATGIGEHVGVRFQPDQLKALDDYIAASNAPKPSRPEAIRALVGKALNPDLAVEPGMMLTDAAAVGALVLFVNDYRDPYFDDGDYREQNRSPNSRISRAISTLDGLALMLDEIGCGRREIPDACQLADMLCLIKDEMDRAQDRMEEAHEQAIARRNALKEMYGDVLAWEKFVADARRPSGKQAA